MKRFKSLKASISMLVIVLLISMLFVSCGGGSVSRSLDDTSLSTDDIGEAVFMVKENDSSDEKAKRRQAISSVLNNVIKARPELLDMLETESSSDHFLQTIQAFAGENYRKAVRIFPEMTRSEFCDYSAIGYAVANHDPDLFEISYVEFLESTDVKTFTPTFDQIMSCAFWTAYSSQRYGIDYQDDQDIPMQDRFECENLDSDISFELGMIVQMATKESLMKGDTEIGHRSGWDDSIVILSLHMTNTLRDFLKSSGVKRVSLDDDDYFSQIGNVSVYLNLLLKHFADGKDFEVKLGHYGAASGIYLNNFEVGKIGECWDVASEICRSLDISATGHLQMVGRTEWNVRLWGVRYIKNWYSPIQP